MECVDALYQTSRVQPVTRNELLSGPLSQFTLYRGWIVACLEPRGVIEFNAQR